MPQNRIANLKMNEKAGRSLMIVGDAASPGVARGTAFVCRCAQHAAPEKRSIRAEEVPVQLEKFDKAVIDAEKDLLNLQKNIHETIGAQEAAIFEAHIALLHDPLLREEIEALCSSEKINIEAALDQAIEKIASLFVRMEDPYFRERAADMRDVGKRLSDILARGGAPKTAVFPSGSVIVTQELFPSILAQLDRHMIRGLVIEKGGQTAHATLLARAAGVPLLIQVPEATRRIRMGDRVLVDGTSGRVFVNPAPEVLREYDKLEADLHAHQTALKGLIHQPAVTQDGTAVRLCANIGKSADAETAANLNADGVGLYRTEFVFLVQDHFPSEEEQYHLYRRAVKHLQSREVVIRVLDIGSDKILPYLPLPLEANPSLGCRGTRLLLAHPEILHVQLRAILRLSAEHPVSVLFPMVSGIEDLLDAKAAVERAKASLSEAGIAFNAGIRIGAMIETPSAAIMAGRLAQEADYLSIGTNDLVQYLLATDRTSSAMATYYEPLHPAVIQVIAAIAAEVKAKGKSFSVCGEMAGNPAYTQLLLGLGVRNFSVSPGELLEVKNSIRSTNLEQAEHLARKVLLLNTVREIKACLREGVCERQAG